MDSTSSHGHSGHMNLHHFNINTTNMTKMMKNNYLSSDMLLAFITLTLLALTGMVINAILVYVTIGLEKRKSISDYLVIHLTIVDLLTTLPTLIYCCIIFKYNGTGWPMSVMIILCKATVFSLTLFYSITVGTLTLMSIERYRAIIHPMKSRMSGKALIGILILLWLIMSIVPLINISNTQINVHNQYLCVLHNQHQHYVVVLNFSYCVVIGYLIPASIMLFCYNKIIKKLKQGSLIARRSLIASQSNHQKKLAIKILISVSILFILSGIPLVIGLIVHIYMDSKLTALTHADHSIIDSFTLLFWILLQFAPLYNPIIYLAKKKRFWHRSNAQSSKITRISPTTTDTK